MADPPPTSRGRAIIEAARRLFLYGLQGPPSTGPNAFASTGAPVAANAGELAVEPCEKGEDEDCPICLAPLGACVRTPCGHCFHKECLEQYFLVAREPGTKARCPICRGAVHAPLPVEAEATSGRPIDIVAAPPVGSRCHIDRHYTFLHLGGFSKPGSALTGRLGARALLSFARADRVCPCSRACAQCSTCSRPTTTARRPRGA